MPDFLFKFIMIGRAGKGKPHLLYWFIRNKFKQDCGCKIRMGFCSKLVSVGEKMVELQIWDTLGEEQYRSMTRSHYRGTAGVWLFYDITSREMYNALTDWLTDVRTLTSPNVVIILCRNKDLNARREVTFLEAARFAWENSELAVDNMASGIQYNVTFLQQVHQPQDAPGSPCQCCSC
ncbi:ras-related protein Rab-4B-like [Phaenicophaeus curvirostris]|uniref:ras-related protein Rab-4B-like n=1 Tax=Phaenicophaeus curvirostris TaxID=33595 RepID=UPI0037F0CA44